MLHTFQNNKYLSVYIYTVTSGPKLISVALETGEEHLPDLITGWSVTPAARHGMAT